VKLLALDTATELCSAALWLDGQISVREELRARGHGELILPMIEALLVQAGLRLQQLDAIAFGRGPGAFTGVRLAVSLAQGLGYSAHLPLIPISNLRALAAQALQLPQAMQRVLVCQDARMGEVYWGCFEYALRSGSQTLAAAGMESVSAPASVLLPAGWSDSTACGAGSGFAAYRAALSGIESQLAAVFPQLLPHAREIAQLAASDGMGCAVPAEYAQPVYLRDDVAKVPTTGTATLWSRN